MGDILAAGKQHDGTEGAGPSAAAKHLVLGDGASASAPHWAPGVGTGCGKSSVVLRRILAAHLEQGATGRVIDPKGPFASELLGERAGE